MNNRSRTEGSTTFSIAISLVSVALLLCGFLCTSCAVTSDEDFIEVEYPVNGYDSNPPSDAIVGKWVLLRRFAGNTFLEGMIFHEDGTCLEVLPLNKHDSEWSWKYQGGGFWAVYTPEFAFDPQYYRVGRPSSTGERVLYCVGSAPINANSTSMKYTRR